MPVAGSQRRSQPRTRRTCPAGTRSPAPTARTRRARRTTSPADAALQHLRDEERQLQRLPGVQPRVARGLVAPGQVGVRELLRPTEAFGDVVAGELDMHAAGVGAEPRVHLEEA